MTFETLLDLLPSLLGHAHAVCRRFVEHLHAGAHGFPGQGARPLSDRVDGLQEGPMPVECQEPPAAFDGGVLALGWRRRDPYDFSSLAVRTLHHPLHALRPTPGMLRKQPNATLQAPPMAGARDEQRLLAVAFRVEPAVAQPAPPQTRTCAINAYGSSVTRVSAPLWCITFCCPA